MSNSSDEVSRLSLIANNILNTGGLFIFICGIIGSLINIVAFATLPQFNGISTSIFLLTSCSGSFITLVTGLLPQLVSSLTGRDPLSKYVILCKLRWFLGVGTATVTIHSLCFATFNQYMITMDSVRFRQMLTRRRAMIMSVLIYCYCAILFSPSLFYYTHVINSANQTVCDVNNPIVAVYNVYNSVVIYTGIPIFVLILFSLLTWRNIRQRSIRRRSSLEKTVARMLFAQVSIVLIAAIAFCARRIYLLYTADFRKTPIQIAEDRIITNVSTLFGFSIHGFTFFIYLTISKAFRRKIFSHITRQHRVSTMNIRVPSRA